MPLGKAPTCNPLIAPRVLSTVPAPGASLLQKSQRVQKSSEFSVRHYSSFLYKTALTVSGISVQGGKKRNQRGITPNTDFLKSDYYSLLPVFFFFIIF